MSGEVREHAGAAVSLGDVTVGLRARVHPSTIDCAVDFRGARVHVVFDGDGNVLEVRLPDGSDPVIRT
jgi:hypothetical protein